MADQVLSSSEEEEEEELWCEVCRKSFSGPVPFKQHEKGTGHRKALRRGDDPPPRSECETCRKEVPVDAWEKHMRGKPHRRTETASRLLKQLKKLNMSKEESPSDVQQTEPNKGNSYQEVDDFDEQQPNMKVFECTECSKAFTGVEPYYIHLQSPAHEKVLKLQGQFRELADSHSQFLKIRDDTLVCVMCKVAFSGPESAEAHLKGRGHRKKADLRQWRREHRAQSKEEKLQDKATEDESVKVESRDSCVEDGENAESQKADDESVKVESRDYCVASHLRSQITITYKAQEEKLQNKATEDESVKVESRDSCVVDGENAESQKADDVWV